ncbi:hypothetical protein VTO73DRAFT_9072 [Trametes versicolor]
MSHLKSASTVDGTFCVAQTKSREPAVYLAAVYAFSDVVYFPKVRDEGATHRASGRPAALTQLAVKASPPETQRAKISHPPTTNSSPSRGLSGPGEEERAHQEHLQEESPEPARSSPTEINEHDIGDLYYDPPVEDPPVEEALEVEPKPAARASVEPPNAAELEEARVQAARHLRRQLLLGLYNNPDNVDAEQQDVAEPDIDEQIVPMLMRTRLASPPPVQEHEIAARDVEVPPDHDHTADQAPAALYTRLGDLPTLTPRSPHEQAYYGSHEKWFTDSTSSLHALNAAVYSDQILPPSSVCPACESPLFSRGMMNIITQFLGMAPPRYVPRFAAPLRPLSCALLDLLIGQPDLVIKFDEWRLVSSPPGQHTRIQDGRIWKTLVGPDGLPFFGPQAHGELRIGAIYHLDWFSCRRSPYAPSHSSGILSFSLTNLERALRYRLQHMLPCAMTPGPGEPDAEELQYYQELLMDDLLILYHEGILVPRPSRQPARRTRVACICASLDLSL